MYILFTGIRIQLFFSDIHQVQSFKNNTMFIINFFCIIVIYFYINSFRLKMNKKTQKYRNIYNVFCFKIICDSNRNF